MSLILQQIFYAHDGQKYQILAHSGTLADNIMINNAVERVCDRLKNRDADGVFWGNFEEGKYHYWFLSSPGEKDYSGRATIILHILLCECSDVSAEIKEKDFLFYSKLQKECPAEKRISDLTVTDEELERSPSVICQNDSKRLCSQAGDPALPPVDCRKSKCKSWIIICILIIVAVTVGYKKGVSNGKESGLKENHEANYDSKERVMKEKDEEINKILKEKNEAVKVIKEKNEEINKILKEKNEAVKEAVKEAIKEKNEEINKILKEIAKHLGIDKRSPDTKDIINEINRLKGTKGHLLRGNSGFSNRKK